MLQYLGDRRPPVTHRDVKPENVVLGGGRAGGRVFLVDFGGVQAAAAGELAGLGSTVIGTYGYMAPGALRKLTGFRVFIWSDFASEVAELGSRAVGTYCCMAPGGLRILFGFSVQCGSLLGA